MSDNDGRRFPVGTRVILYGLQSAHHLNSLVGVVTGYDSEQGRYEVRLDVNALDSYAAKSVGLGNGVKVKPINFGSRAISEGC